MKTTKTQLFNSVTVTSIQLRTALLADPTITAHGSEIAGVDEIGFNNSEVDQLVNEHKNYEIFRSGI